MSLTTSCEKKLDVDQHGVTPMSEFYKTDAQCEGAIASLYHRWIQIFMQFDYITNLMSDDCYAGDAARGSNKAIEELNEFTYDPSNNWILQLYQYLYQVNYRANVILDNMGEPDTPVKRQIASECHFFRGWTHFYLAALWGTPPVVDHVLTQEEYSIPNSDKATLWAFIENEFKTAAEGSLPSKANANDVVVRVTKEAALSMLGKAYVFEEKWAEARTTLDGVINSGKYALYDVGGTDYENIILQSTEFNCESILEANVVEDPSNRIGGWPSCVEIVYGWRKALMHIEPGKGLAVEQAFGIGNPRHALYDAFVEREGVDGYRLNSTLKTYDQIKADGHYILPGVTIEQHDGIFIWKMRADANSLYYDGVWRGESSHNNRHYMRYAEVLLLAAEAHLHGGEASKAAEYVNAIRERAKLPALASVTMDDVKIEKRLELCFEHVRYMDLVRWGDAPTALGTQGRVIGTFSSDGVWEPDHAAFSNPQGGFRAGKNELLPFPRLELISNRAMVQNPGY